MFRRPSPSLWLIAVLCMIITAAAPLLAVVVPDRASPVAERQHRDAGLDIRNAFRAPGELPPQAAAQARNDLAALGVPEGSGRVDLRGGGWGASRWSPATASATA